MFIRSVFVAWICVLPLVAQQPKRVILRAGKVLDVKSGRTLSNQAIVIEAGKIVSIGGDAKPNTGDQVIELPNATVLPGLIDRRSAPDRLSGARYLCAARDSHRSA
jgi:hypothetical protein